MATVPIDPQASVPTVLLASDVLLAAQTKDAREEVDTEGHAPLLAVVRTEEETRAIEASLALLLPAAAENESDEKDIFF
ncbi:hypothetical protein Z042_07410 [Chania multitudinisentens RB-25]|uniref:Uncharacterized protein n=2 Tax=Chania TaxID=1745211 RepID=W0LL18_9GAMM|nr:hypothetical protein Z042_07410 [Chania multitudinisentens RB-25]